MKVNTITMGALASLLLSSPIVGAEDKYPAADFKPKVQYQDSDYIANTAKEPAKAQAAAKPTESDSRYPATNFEPKVVYQDSEYKHTTPKVATPSAKTSSSSVSSSTEVASAESATQEAKSDNTLIILVAVLAAVGFLVFRRSSGVAKSGASASAYYQGNSGTTGVARYLNKLEGSAVTGVAKYLERQAASVQEKVATTGVDKYLEKKELESETGVSKYLRTKG